MIPDRANAPVKLQPHKGDIKRFSILSIPVISINKEDQVTGIPEHRKRDNNAEYYPGQAFHPTQLSFRSHNYGKENAGIRDISMSLCMPLS